jgi:nitroreductase
MQWANFGANSGLNVFETILARRSVRSYQERDVDRKTVRTLLEAAVRAPTAFHDEPWAFVVVQNGPLLHRISELAGPLFAESRGNSGTNHGGRSFEHLAGAGCNVFHDAGTLVVICARAGDPLVVADCWLAAENLMLAACALGLGTCVIGAAVAALNTPAIKAELCIPDECSAIAPIVVGHPRGETPATLRREPVVLAWH